MLGKFVNLILFALTKDNFFRFQIFALLSLKKVHWDNFAALTEKKRTENWNKEVYWDNFAIIDKKRSGLKTVTKKCTGITLLL